MDSNNLDDRLANLPPEKRALFELRLKQKASAGSVKARIPRRTPAEPIPLSFAQQRLWFLDQLESGSTVYNVPGAVRMRGQLDVTALEQSLNEIVRRHEILRTTFSTVEGEAVQIISSSLSVSLSVVDLSEQAESEREEEARRLAREEARRPFDLARGPLVRATLISLAPEDHVLLLSLHHIVSDGWSMGVLYRELSALYEAFSKGQPSPLADLPIQYADFGVWQREWLAGEVLESQLSYWRAQLGDVALLQLPTDRPRPAVQSYRGERQSIELSKELTQGLKALGRRHDVTLYMTLLAAFQTLLYRYTGQDDISVGSPIANRNRTEIESLIGFFVNTLVMRSDLSGNPTFRELLARVRETALGAYAHQDIPFEKLVEELNPERNLSYSPLFQVMFVLQNAPAPLREFAGLTLRSFAVQTETAKFDLTLSMREEAEGLKGSLQYSTDLFNDVTIKRMIGHFVVLLEGIVADPERRVSELPLLTEAERHQLLVEWNDTKGDYPKDGCIHQLFEAQVEKTPDAIALIFENQQLTYRELNTRANQLAHYLWKLGIAHDVLVGVCMDRSLDMIVAMLGILKAGGAYVPLDPSYPRDRLAFMIQDTQVSVILTDVNCVGELPPSDARVIPLDEDWKDIGQEVTENPEFFSTPAQLAYVMYTSGSTGKPKGVEVPHRGITRLFFGTDYAQLDANQTFLHLAPAAFDASTFEIWSALLHGAKCVLFPERVPCPQDLGEIIKRQGVTTLWLTASLFNTVIDEAAKTLSGVRQLLIGGEALSVAHVRRGLEWLPHTEIINGYGPTESTTFACCFRIPRKLDENIRSIPIGKPIGNTKVYILDRQKNPVPIGVAGELYIGGDGLARGYLHRPELTAERFITHSFDGEASQRLYKTGDLACYLPDGNIEFLGRLDNQVKVRGYRIELGEIEAALGQHPGVRESIVIVSEGSARESDNPKPVLSQAEESAIQNPKFDKRLVAYVVKNPASTASTSELRGFLKQKLPEYMIPSALVFLDVLPLTPSGKVDRRALPHPDPSHVDDQTAYVAPRTTTEKMLASVWAEVLGLERVGMHDNFFDLGGHSMLVVRLFARIKKVSGKEISMSTLFRAPTIEQFAQLLERERRGTRPSTLVPIQSRGSSAPFFCVHGAWGSVVFGAELARRLGSDQPFYGLQAPGLDGEQEPLTRIEGMAVHHIREMRRVQPEGPYFLGGLSMGGLVAFEIAQQLFAQGQTVALLILIDTHRPIRNSLVHLWGNRVRQLFVDDLVGRFVFHGRNLLQRGSAQRSTYTREKTWILGKRIAAKLRLDHRGIQAHLGDIYAVKVRKANIEAMRKYEPQSYAGRITLLMTSESPARRYDSRKGWRELAVGGLDIHVVPGDHNTMIKEPHARVLAEKLQNCLQKAQTTQRGPAPRLN